MPAPTGNINGARNGKRITGNMIRLNLGELPGTMRRQLSTARKYRRNLEDAVQATKGEVSLQDAHLINEAVVAETHASICQWLLRDRLDKMSVNDIVTCSREILKAKGTRNRAFQKLGLDQAQEDLITALYTTELPPSLPGTVQEAGNAGNVLGSQHHTADGTTDAEEPKHDQ